jgi:hypothetical protein
MKDERSTTVDTPRSLYEESSKLLKNPEIQQMYTQMWDRITRQAIQPSFETKAEGKEREAPIAPDHL